ncbi:MAG: hypothetical protein JWR24_4784 [Actinoallomurus sp.]|nr:hypothetical protein [Actinoallomurus sp.]
MLRARASARLAQREISGSVRLTGRAFEIALKMRSSRNLRYMGYLRPRLGPYRRMRAVRGLDEQVGL